MALLLILAAVGLMVGSVCRTCHGQIQQNDTDSAMIQNQTEPAKIVIHPSPYSKVYPHQTVMSLCSAYGGDEPPTISWRFGDELLTNDSLDLVKIFETQSIHNGLVFTESILELCAVDLNDTGVYSCTATNSQGSDRYNFTLDVVPAEIPRIVDYTNITGPLALGDSANLSCQASGGPLPTFQWYRDDVLLYNFENSEDGNLTRSLLELHDLTFSDSGTYRCQAISIAGNASTEFKVVVMQGEARVTTLSMNSTVYTMESILASCSGTGFPQTSITWIHGGQALANNSRITIYENTTEDNSGLTSVLSMLEVCSITISDEGVYECVVTNRLVNDSANFTLTVREPPQILIAPSANIEAYDETTVVTMCMGYGKDEVPRLQWKYMENILTNDTPSFVIHETQCTENGRIFVESILIFCDIGLNNAGNYSCTVNNSFGYAESTFTLNVKINQPTELLIIPVNKSIVDSGQTAYFVCVGLSEIEHTDILWRYNGNVLTNDSTLIGLYTTEVAHDDRLYTSSILELCGLNLDRTGTYSCTAGYSRQGNSSSFTLLITFELNCTVDESGLITIDCIEIDGEIDPGQIFCIYDNGRREPCGLQTIIDYSRFDNDPGSHNITIVAVSTTEQQVDFDYAFNVPEIECVQLTEPGRTTIVCATRLTLHSNGRSCILDMQRAIDCNIDTGYIVLDREFVGSASANLVISDQTDSGFKTENFKITISGSQDVVCSTTLDCSESSSFPMMMSARDCCVNRENGFSYSMPRGECYQCKVLGWLKDSFTEIERISPHTLLAGYRKGGEQAGVNVSFNIISQTQTASDSDFYLDADAVTVVPTGDAGVNIVFESDADSNEEGETLILILVPKPFTLQTFPRGEAVFFMNSINLTILDHKALPTPVLIGVTVGGFLFLLMSAIAIIVPCVVCHYYRIHRQKKLILDQSLPPRDQSGYAMEQRSPDEQVFSGRSVDASFKFDLPPHLIIQSSNIKLTETIGQGEYGIVYKGFLGGTITELVAIKTLKGFYDPSAARNMLKECSKMYHFKHPNVLTLCGVCLDGGPAPYIIMPFMANGSLLAYLKKNKGTLIVSCDDDDGEVEIIRMRLTDMCIQVAKGMEYLTSMKVVHRDLAARNCMIDMNAVIKVADFGLSESMDKEYYRQDQTSGIKLPLKWMPPESIEYGVFSEKSDVWSYGVTCWEIFSAGKVPYPGVAPTNLPKLVAQGVHLDMPANDACNDELFQFMLKCWEISPETRPTFSFIVRSLSKVLDGMAGYMDIDNLKGVQNIMDDSGNTSISNEPISDSK